MAAKVYYHLQEYNESMAFALGAGKHFQIDRAGEFEDMITSKCVDTFIALSASKEPILAADAHSPTLEKTLSRTEGAANMTASLSSPVTPFSQSTLPSKSLLSRSNTTTYDPTAGMVAGDANSPQTIILQRGLQRQLNAVIERLFEKCFQEKRYRQVVGIAVEARNLDILRRVVLRAAQDEKKGGPQAAKASQELMDYVLDICMNVVQERGLRNEILRLILELLNDIPAPDYFAIAKCVVYLDQHSLASDILRNLVDKGDARSLAVAYQISFDLYDNSTQEFLRKVREELAEMLPPESPAAGQPEKMDDEEADVKAEEQLQSELQQSVGASKSRHVKVEQSDRQEALRSCRSILDGLNSIHLNIEFLNKSNRVDLSILKKIMSSLEARNSIFHTATTLATGFMHAKTANDNFFRDNLEWLGKAVNWSKFTATAALGVIHQGNVNHVDRLLSPYLPKQSAGGPLQGSAYSQGGSLYAYGLVCANHKEKAVDFIREKFKENTDEIVQHGGALGLGVAGMASGDQGVYGDLKQVLYSDSAINGEAVGLAMGLVMLGSGNVGALSEMVQYAHDTQHEKIVRGLAMGMAMIMYGRQEGADEISQGLLNDPDPSLRYGGILTIALAYVGTGSNKAVRKLLHVAVSDVNDDVRRIAVLSLGFVLFRKHTSVPRMVELLAESYNPHVRYGAAMALGISCAGTGLDEATDLLEPMLKDPTDFVRQGALIALSMILIQQNDVTNSKVTSIRKTMLKIIGDRHEDAMTKFGCAMAMGIIDAGGRNCTISLQTQTGNLHMPGIVGMMVFTQYWYWFPMAHFLSLAFTPTSIIAVDQNLQAPVFKFHCNTKPSTFDYPPEQTAKVETGPEKVKTAVLSTTAQAKRRAAKKEKAAKDEGMEVDPVTPTVGKDDKMDTDAKEEDEEDETTAPTTAEASKDTEEQKEETRRAKREKEKVGYEIANMARVLPAQLKYVTFPDARYKPVKSPITGGIMVVLDTKPQEDQDTIPLTVSKKVVPPAPAVQHHAPGAPSAPTARGLTVPQTPGSQTIGRMGGPGSAAAGLGLGTGLGAGAAAAAGVLTAADEDQEGDEEAETPGEFEYETDHEDE